MNIHLKKPLEMSENWGLPPKKQGERSHFSTRILVPMTHSDSPTLLTNLPGLFGRWKPVLRWMWINVWEWYNTFRWAKFISWEVFGIAAANLFVYFVYPQNHQKKAEQLSGSDCELKINKPCRLEPEIPISKDSRLGLPRYIRARKTPQKWWKKKTRQFPISKWAPNFPFGHRKFQIFFLAQKFWTISKLYLVFLGHLEGK